MIAAREPHVDIEYKDIPKENFPDNTEYGREYHYLGNSMIKKAHVKLQWTPDMLEEFKRCAADPIYFIIRWMNVLHVDHGIVPFDLYDYQKNLIDHFNDNRFSVVLASRQSGKSITAVGYLLWYALFHPAKPIAIAANKGDTAREMLERLMTALEGIPFFLQNGCVEYNKGSIIFENKSKIVAGSTSSSSIRGKAVALLYLDEFAFVENAETFYTATYPVITSGKTTKVIITSTANGIGNQFYNIWQKAITDKSEYAPFRVDWFDVPGRDEAWKKQTIENTSEVQFAQEFSNDFLGTGNTLINANAIMGLVDYDPIYLNNNVRLYKEPIPEHEYVMTVDVAKGRGQDYSAFSIIDVTTRPFEVVGTLYDNMISPLLLPTVIERYAKMYNNAYVVVESNDQGSLVCNILYQDIEYENMYVSSTVDKNGIGVEMNKKIKRLGCSNIKDLIEEKKLLCHDKNTIQELMTFVAKGTSYEADGNAHDDLVMTLVIFGWFSTNPIFAEMTNKEIKHLLYEERMQAIEAELTPFGIIYDHQPEETLVDGGGQLWEIADEHNFGSDHIFSGWQRIG